MFWEVTLVTGNKKGESEHVVTFPSGYVILSNIQIYTDSVLFNKVFSFFLFFQITRRYAEFSAAIVSLNESFPDEKVLGIVKP